MAEEQIQIILQQQDELHARLRAPEEQLAEARARSASAPAVPHTPVMPMFVDTNASGKPQVFSGDVKDWKTWSFGFISF
eukprot:6206168-Amphidinium_carterae.1